METLKQKGLEKAAELKGGKVANAEPIPYVVGYTYIWAVTNHKLEQRRWGAQLTNGVRCFRKMRMNTAPHSSRPQ